MDTSSLGQLPTHTKGRPVPPAYAEATMRAVGLEPLVSYPGGNTPWECGCNRCGEIVTPRWAQVDNGTSPGCKYCAKEDHSNYTNHDEAVRLMRVANLQPLDAFPGTNVKWRSNCLVCEREVFPRYKTVRAGGRACVECEKDEIAQAAVVVMEAVGLYPLTAYPGSDKRWKCRCGECGKTCAPVYKYVVSGVGRGCSRTCAAAVKARALIVAETDEAVAALTTQGFEPLAAYPGRGKKWAARCARCEREDEPRYPNLLTYSGGLGCVVCRGHRVDPQEAEGVMRAAGFEPLVPYSGAGDWPCRCVGCKRDVSPSYSSVRRGDGCGHCAGVITDPDEAAVFMRAQGLEPLVPYPGSGTPWPCLCTQCEEVVQPCHSAVKGGHQSPCKHCHEKNRDRRVPRTEESIATGVMRAAGLEPLDPFPGVKSAWRSRCQECKRIVSPAMYAVREGLSGCAFCSKNRVDPVEAAEAMMARGFDPLAPYPGSVQPWLCRCSGCGTGRPVRYSAIKAGANCGVCTGKVILPEVADETMRSLGFIPQEPYPGRVSARWLCVCTLCGRETSPTYKGARLGVRAGCCTGKYDLRIPGRSIGVYLMTHETFGAAKFGIGIVHANGHMPRVRSHELNGWTLERAWTGIPALRTGFEVERAILDWWRSSGLPPFLTRAQMPQCGNTETVELALIDLAEVRCRVEDELAIRGVESAQQVA